MARARNIKPGLYKNEDLAECSIWARYIFPGLWTLADRDGRLEDRPKRIKGELLPFDAQDVEPLLDELATREDAQGIPFIVRYENSDGAFIQISKFGKHQTPHYTEKKSVIKPPQLQENSGDTGTPLTGEPPEPSSEHSGKSPVIKRGPLPPDSLIHRFTDSPNPDSPNPEGGGAAGLTTSPSETASPSEEKTRAALPEDQGQGQPPPDASVEAALRKLGVTVKRDLPRPWSNGDVPIALLIRAVATARQRKPEGPIPVKYLEPIVEELRAGGPASTSAPADPNAGTIVCESCGEHVRSYTGRQCDPCWSGKKVIHKAPTAAAA